MEEAPRVYNQRFEQLQDLGQGSFGRVYTCMDLEDERFCALKVEPVCARCPQLLAEAEVMKDLQSIAGIPALYWAGTEHTTHAIAMELLGRSFDQLLEDCGGRFSLRTTLLAGDQMLQRLEAIHNCEYVHRDVKPENFAVGRHANENLVYILDFGLARKFVVDGRHIPAMENRGVTGTIRYASLNAHMGLELSRRDDLESLFYLLTYFYRGALPWQGVTSHSKAEKYRRIMEIKLNTPFDVLTKGLPQEFTAGFRYVRSLKFDTKPNYPFLRKLLRDTLSALGGTGSPRFDWSLSPTHLAFPGRKKEKSTAMAIMRRSSAAGLDSKSCGSQSTQSGHIPFFKVSVREKVFKLQTPERKLS